MSKKRGNGEGTIYYNQKLKRWIGQITIGRQDNGKIKRKSIYGNSRQEVKEKMINILNDIQNSTYIEKNNISLIEVIDAQINESFNLNKIKETTYIRNVQTKEIIKKFNIANMPIQKITRTDINQDLSTLKNKYANSTIDKIYGLIRQAFNFAVLNDYISKDFFNIKDCIIKPISTKKTKAVNAFSTYEQKLFLNELQKNYDEYTDIFYILLYTGIRVGEVLALKGEDIDLKNKQININKTLTKNKQDKVIIGETTKTSSATRTVPIMSQLFSILQKYNQFKGFLFMQNNKFIAPSTINSHFKRICKNAGIGVITTKKKKIITNKEGNIKEQYVNLKTSIANTHMLRHTFATRCIENGINPAVLQKLLGHKNVQTTLDTYTTIFNKYKTEEIEKIEQYFNQLH